MFGYFVFENPISATPFGETHARAAGVADGAGDGRSVTTVTSAQPAARAARQRSDTIRSIGAAPYRRPRTPEAVEVRFRLARHAGLMNTVEYIPIRTSGGAVVL